jgi:hypothetical protein
MYETLRNPGRKGCKTFLYWRASVRRVSGYENEDKKKK